MAGELEAQPPGRRDEARQPAGKRLAGHKVAANVLMLLAFVLGTIGITRMNVQFFPTFELDVIWKVVDRRLGRGGRARHHRPARGAPGRGRAQEDELDLGSGGRQHHARAARGHRRPARARPGAPARRRVPQPAARRQGPRRSAGCRATSRSRACSCAAAALKGCAPGCAASSELLAAGIDRITLTGLPEERIAVEVPAAALETLGLSLVQVGERVGQLARDGAFPPASPAEPARRARDRDLEQRRGADAFARFRW